MFVRNALALIKMYDVAHLCSVAVCMITTTITMNCHIVKIHFYTYAASEVCRQNLIWTNSTIFSEEPSKNNVQRILYVSTLVSRQNSTREKSSH